MSSPEFIGSELRLEAPAAVSLKLLEAGLEDESNAVTTIELAALSRPHPFGLGVGIRALRALLYPGNQLQPRQVTGTNGAEKDILAAYEKYKVGHLQRLTHLSDQANHFLGQYPHSLIFMSDEGWESVSEVGVTQPDERWQRVPELYVRSADRKVLLQEGQLQCNRAALGAEVELRLAALPHDAED